MGFYEDSFERVHERFERIFPRVGLNNVEQQVNKMVNQDKAILLFLAPYCHSSLKLIKEIAEHERLWQYLENFKIEAAHIYPELDEHLGVFVKYRVNSTPKAIFFSRNNPVLQLNTTEVAVRCLIEGIERVLL